MKICILGAGALGSAIGGCLSEAGSDVYLVSNAADHIEAMRANGLRLREEGQDRNVKVNAALDSIEIGPVDLVVLLVKSFHTRVAIEGASSLIGPNTVVLSLQNGLGHEEVLSEMVGRQRVIAGKTYIGGVMLGPGHVLAARHGKLTIIGELDGTISERALRVSQEFERAGLHVKVDDNIVGKMWDKLLINAATGPLCGITRLPYGELYKLQEMRDCALKAVSEAMTVAKALGVRLSIDDPAEVWRLAAEGLPAEFKPSMLQSIEMGSVTEIDCVNGAVVRLGRKMGMPTPVNDVLVSCVKGIERALLLP
ncbi:ketopantoate reductase family protein [Burkholderia ambifaria]|uniref:ketopantoate reductase family protein n=1 Tax=Burkholderia ambifaria TaxID=152480 RepID=UPI001B8EA59D|nr:ketopantoate reductase family protein [Burkholderia ambifaria]MBR8257560.1 ketopantoate reductase family protein [Burkholderia ambifaria]